MNIAELTEQIDRGEFDDDLKTLRHAISARIEMRSEARDNAVWSSLTPGSLCAFNSHVRPKYMMGLTAKVVKRNPRKIVVRLTDEALETIRYRAPQSAHKWRGQVTAYVSTLRKIDATLVAGNPSVN